MIILEKRISYDNYMSAHGKTGAVTKHLQDRVNANSLTDKERASISPVSKDEWIDMYGSLEGPVCSYIKLGTLKDGLSDQNVTTLLTGDDEKDRSVVKYFESQGYSVLLDHDEIAESHTKDY